MKPDQSRRSLKQTTGIPKYSIHLNLKKDKSSEFCDITSNRFPKNRNLRFNICFIEEYSFYVRYLFGEIPHDVRKLHTQYPEN